MNKIYNMWWHVLRKYKRINHEYVNKTQWSFRILRSAFLQKLICSKKQYLCLENCRLEGLGSSLVFYTGTLRKLVTSCHLLMNVNSCNIAKSDHLVILVVRGTRISINRRVSSLDLWKTLTLSFRRAVSPNTAGALWNAIRPALALCKPLWVRRYQKGLNERTIQPSWPAQKK